MKNNNSGKWVKGFLFGALIGGIAALLNAPQEGKETRKQIVEKTDEMTTQALDSYEVNRTRLETRLDTLIKESRKRTSNLATIGRDLLEAQQAMLKKSMKRTREEVLQPNP